MSRLSKTTMLLYPCVVAVSAATIIYDGSINLAGYEYIKFDTSSTSPYAITINKVLIDKSKLDPREGVQEITLIIPGATSANK